MFRKRNEVQTRKWGFGLEKSGTVQHKRQEGRQNEEEQRVTV